MSAPYIVDILGKYNHHMDDNEDDTEVEDFALMVEKSESKPGQDRTERVQYSCHLNLKMLMEIEVDCEQLTQHSLNCLASIGEVKLRP